MNKERMVALANFLEGLNPKRFDMTTWADRKQEPDADGSPRPSVGIDPKALVINECGTRGCLAGWTIYLFADRPAFEDANDNARETPEREACDLLDLTPEQAKRLFYGHFDKMPNECISPQRAALAVRNEMAVFNWGNFLRRCNKEGSSFS